MWADYLQGYAIWRGSEDLTFTVGGGYYRNGLAPSRPVTASGFGASAGGDLRLARHLFAHGGYDYLGQTDPTGLGLQLARHVFSARLEYRKW